MARSTGRPAEYVRTSSSTTATVAAQLRTSFADRERSRVAAMADRVSVRPSNLADFVTSSDSARRQLESAGAAKTSNFLSFLSAPGGHYGEEGRRLISTALPQLLSDLQEVRDFVDLVRAAVLRADGRAVDGTVTVGSAAVMAALQSLARERGVDLSDVFDVSPTMTVPLPEVGAVPPNSGYVNDPVCTATGLLVMEAVSLTMPNRLQLLGVPRWYASEIEANRDARAFGPGWWTHLDVRAHIRDGAYIVACPDGSIREVTPDNRVGGDGLVAVVDWPVGTPWVGQTWRFGGDGRLSVVTGERIGTTTFVRRRSNVIRIEHDSGRQVTVEWQGKRIHSLRSSDGRVARFRYDAGCLVEAPDDLHPRRFEVDERGRVAGLVDADGVVVERMVYDDGGRVVQQTAATGLVTRFGYRSPFTTTVADTDGPAVSFSHDARGRVELYVARDGLRLRRTFDEYGRVTAQEQSDGRSFRVERQQLAAGWSEQRTWNNGLTELFEYDDVGRLRRFGDLDGDRTYGYEGASRLPRRVTTDQGWAEFTWVNGALGSIVDSDGCTMSFGIDAFGQVESITDADGHRTTLIPGDDGVPLSAVLPSGVSMSPPTMITLQSAAPGADAPTTVQLTPGGRVRRIVDAEGNSSEFEYDGAGLLSTTTAPDGAVTRWEFNDAAELIAVAYADGSGDHFERDALGRVTHRTVSGVAAGFSFGADGMLARVTDAAGSVTSYVRNHVERTEQVTSPAGVERWAFDPRGRVLSHTASDGVVRSIAYAAGRPCEWRVDGRVTSRQHYTSMGRLSRTERVSAFGTRSVSYMHDRRGFVESLTFDEGSPWRIERDELGRAVQVRSPEGRVTRLAYDACGRLVETARSTVERFHYDRVGRLTCVEDELGGRVQYAYDRASRLVAVTDQVGGTTQYAYDPCGRLRSVIDADGATSVYERDRHGRVTAIVDPLGRRTTVQLDGAGHPQTLVFADGSSRSATTSVLDTVARTARSVERDSDNLIVGIQAHGLLATIARSEVGSPSSIRLDDDASTSRLTFERDSLDRINQRVDDHGVHRYEYDAAGRLIAWTAPDGGIARYSFGAAGQLVREQHPDGSERTFWYDAAYQLIRCEDHHGVTTYEYDVRGRRIAEHGPKPRQFLWNEYGLVRVTDVAGSITVDVHDDGRPHDIDGHAVTWTNDVIPVPAKVGDEAVVVDAGLVGIVGIVGGQSRWCRPSESPWGDGPSTATPTIHPMCGIHMRDLVWFGERVYDPSTRQFLSPDPQPTPRREPLQSPYVYASCDPINRCDPSGRKPISLDEFNRLMDEATGVQWDTIKDAAKVVAVVAVAVVVVAVTGPAVLALAPAIAGATGLGTVGSFVVAGAVVGAAGGAVNATAQAAIMNGRFPTPGELAKGAVVGAVIGGATGGGLGAVAQAGSGGSKVVQTVFGSSSSTMHGAAQGAGQGLVEGTASELYDKTGLPGADGSFDSGEVIKTTVAGAGGGALGHHVSAGHHSASQSPSAPGPGPSNVEPPTLPVKGNYGANNEMIYHTPDSPWYDRVDAEEVFDSADDAANAGFRPPKVQPNLPQPRP
jgi:RHS repeat-associated protein